MAGALNLVLEPLAVETSCFGLDFYRFCAGPRPPKCSNLKNEDFPGIDLQQLGWRRWRRSQRRCYKFRLVAGSTAPSNTFIANKSITIPPGTLDPSSRSPCRRLTHFCPTQIPKVPFSVGNSISDPWGNHKSQTVIRVCFPNCSSPLCLHLNQSIKTLLALPPSPPAAGTAKDWSVGKKRPLSKVLRKKRSKVFLPIPLFPPAGREGGRRLNWWGCIRQAALLFHACVHQPACCARPFAQIHKIQIQIQIRIKIN